MAQASRSPTELRWLNLKDVPEAVLIGPVLIWILKASWATALWAAVLIGSRTQALALFRSFLPEAGEVDAIVRQDIEFVDSGENFGTIVCPNCDSQIPTGWWVEQMNAASIQAGISPRTK